MKMKPLIFNLNLEFIEVIFIADLIVWLFIILIKGKSGSIYNVGSNTEIAIDGLANKAVFTFKV